MIAVELARQLKRVRTYVSFGIVALIPIILTIAYKFGGTPHRGKHAIAMIDLTSHSGLNVPIIGLSVMGIVFVIVAASFAGEAVAGEASWGALRYLLIRPVRRGRILAGKLAVVAVLVVVAILIAVVVSLVAGVIAFGWHPVYVFASNVGNGIGVLGKPVGAISEVAALARVALSGAYVIWSLAFVVAFAFMLSTLTDKAFGAIAGGFGIAVVSQILDAISQLGSIRYGLPTHYMEAWNGLFVQPTQTADMVRGALLQIPYVLVFGAIAWWWFRRKDITS